MKPQAFLILAFIVAGLVAGFSMKAPRVEPSHVAPPQVEATQVEEPQFEEPTEKPISFTRFLNQANRCSLIGMSINDFLKNYAGPEFSLGAGVGAGAAPDTEASEYVDEEWSKRERYIEFFIGIEATKNTSQYLAVHFDKDARISKAEVTKKDGIWTPSERTDILGDVVGVDVFTSPNAAKD